MVVVTADVGAEGDEGEFVELLGENRIGRVRVHVQSVRQLQTLLLVAQDVAGRLTRALGDFAGFLTGRRFFGLGRRLLDPLRAETNPSEEPPDSARQALHRVHRMHHHLAGGLYGLGTSPRQRLREDLGLALVRQFQHRWNFRDPDPKQLDAVNLQRPKLGVQREHGHQAVSRHRVVHVEALSGEQGRGHQVFRVQDRRRFKLAGRIGGDGCGRHEHYDGQRGKRRPVPAPGRRERVSEYR